MKWLKSLLNSPLKDILPGKVRLWHLLVAVIVGVAVLIFRNPGGRPFDGNHPVTPPTPFVDIDDPKSILAALQTTFDADGPPTPVVLHLARACEAVYANGETSVPRLFFDTGFDRVVPVGFGSNSAVVGLKDDIAVVVFRGTDEIKDWYTNLNVRWDSVKHGRLHAGFWSAYQSLREEIVKQLTSRDIKTVWICGHSLGGAMALCCAYDLSNSNTIPISGVITFGQPKLADRPLAAHLSNSLSGKYLAVVADEDPVADTVPLCHFCGSSIWFDGDRIRFDNSRTDVMQNGETVFGVGSQGEDDAFFKDVMSEDELLQKQKDLAELEPQPFNLDEPLVVKSSLPFFRDHNMSNYIAKLKNYFASGSSGGRN